MKRALSLALALTLAALPNVARAQDGVTFQDGDQIKLANVDNAVVASWGGVYLGPYTGQLVSDPTQPMFTMYCVDYDHEISLGQTWTINESNLATSDLSQTREGTSGLGTYQQTAYLASLFDSWNLLSGVQWDPLHSTQTFGQYFASIGSGVTWSQRNVWSGIHAAIWSMTAASFPTAGSLADALAHAFAVYADYQYGQGFAGTGINFAEWSVLSPTPLAGTGTAQEMLVRTTVTPEPETWVMLGTGMLLLFGFARKRRPGVGSA
jgi:hypothetical protein